MGQSLVKNYIHLVFSTKNRVPFIKPEFEIELHSYLGSLCNELECQAIKIGGYDDHVHVLCMLSKKIALMKFVEVLKSHSSKWMKTRHQTLADFYWQDGYSAFSVNPSQLNKLIDYIANQRKHHSETSFQDEIRVALKKHQMEYDERFIWL